MGLIDKHIKTIINLSTDIEDNDIYNIYQLKGAIPEKRVKTTTTDYSLIPYTQEDMFVLFGVEEGDNGKDCIVMTDQSGAPYNTIVITNTYNVKVLFNGNDSDFYALKFKAKIWSKKVQLYLEENNISIATQNPTISFETEEVAGEFWDKRGIAFKVVVELHFKEQEPEDIKTISTINTYKID